ncbi:MAG: C4-dicarboxylate ABC transporter, partial [Glaciecola sp.]|nr:C4-dicarboxylate ABC transporter [Glaciecola sp.]
TLIIMYYGYGYAIDAYQMNEGSPDPGGLPHRWIIRSVIPISNVFLLLCIFYTILENVLKLQGPNEHEDHIHNEGV